LPFTAFHLGPGIAVKALGGRQVSFLAFAFAQVAMDVEPLIGLQRGAEVLHGPTHNYLAAAIIGLAVALLTPPLGRPILRAWNRWLTTRRLTWLVSPEKLGLVPILLGALLGTLSHVALDSFLYADITPFAPFSDSNALRGVLSMQAVYLSCAAVGLAGLLAWGISSWRRKGKA
jgi:hypothetical protein